MSVHTWGGGGSGQLANGGGGSGQAGGGQVSQPMGGGQVQLVGGGQVQPAGGGVSILRPLAGGMPLAFTQEDFLVTCRNLQLRQLFPRLVPSFFPFKYVS